MPPVPNEDDKSVYIRNWWATSDPLVHNEGEKHIERENRKGDTERDRKRK